MSNVTQRPMTAYERIITAMRSRGRQDSARGFCTKIGLSPTYLSQLKVRCGRNPDTTIGSGEAQLIAEELGASIEEVLGVDESAPTRDEYPSRADAVVAAKALKFSQSAIESVYLDHPIKDPGRIWWFRRIEAENSRISEESLPSRPSLTVERSSRSRSTR